MRALLLLTLLIPLLCVARNAHAQIHRCIGANGEPVFTDQPCGASELAVNTSSGALDSTAADTDLRGGSEVAFASPLAAACPRSPQQVRDRVAVAFASNDPNVLAGLFDWRGFDHHSANARLREFRQWLKRPLASVDFSGAADPSGAQPGDADYTPSHPSGLTVLTQSRGDNDDAMPDARSFGMVDRGGCWWLTF